MGRSGHTPAHRSRSRGCRRGKETSLNSGARPPSPSLVPAPGRIPTGQTGRGRRGPLPPRARAQSPACASPGAAGEGKGESPSVGGLILLPPARRWGGRGTLAP